MTTKNNTQTNTKEFGLLSMIAMVMGIVIGSGIFAKNAGLIETNGSIYITFAAWVVGALLVLSIVIAFMELFTMTEKANEQSTYANWGRMLIGPNFAKFAGYYFIFVNLPISIVTMSFFAGNRVVDVLFVDTNVISTTTAYFITRVVIVTMMLAYFFTVNGFYTKPGKYLQNIGTTVKVIPLVFVFVLLVGMMVFNFNSLNPIFSKDFNDQLAAANNVDNSGMGGLLAFAATMPAIIFVFDGFLTSGSLSKEAKTPTTYRSAVLIGIIAITAIYFTYSLGVFALGDPEASSYGEINNAIINVFGEGAQWFASLITLVIAISIITSVSGVMMSCIRGVSDLSSNNLIPDSKGTTLYRNKHNALPEAMKVVLFISIGYFIMVVSLDAIAIPTNGWATDSYFHTTAASDFLSNLTSVGSFIIMAILLGAGMHNRRTGRVDSEKFKVFIPAAIVAISTLVIILIIYSVQLFWYAPPEVGVDEYNRMYVIQIVSTLLWLVLTPIWFFILNKFNNKQNEEDIFTKQAIIEQYKS